MDNKCSSSVERIELLIRTICFNVKQKGREILAAFDITPPQFNALQFLVKEGEMTVSELSSKLFLAPSTITDLIDRMENGNLVERIRDTKDRRTVKIKVKEKGFSLIDEVIAKRCSYIESLLRDMSEDDKGKFINYLGLLEKRD